MGWLIFRAKATPVSDTRYGHSSPGVPRRRSTCRANDGDLDRDKARVPRPLPRADPHFSYSRGYRTDEKSRSPAASAWEWPSATSLPGPLRPAQWSSLTVIFRTVFVLNARASVLLGASWCRLVPPGAVLCRFVALASPRTVSVPVVVPPRICPVTAYAWGAGVFQRRSPPTGRTVEGLCTSRSSLAVRFKIACAKKGGSLMCVHPQGTTNDVQITIRIPILVLVVVVVVLYLLAGF